MWRKGTAENHTPQWKCVDCIQMPERHWKLTYFCLEGTQLSAYVACGHLYVFFWVIPLRLNYIYMPTFRNTLSHLHTYLPMKMEQTECSETSAYIRFSRRGITQKKEYNVQNVTKVLKSRMLSFIDRRRHFFGVTRRTLFFILVNLVIYVRRITKIM